MKRVLSVAIFLVRIVDDFVEDVFELAAIVVELIVLKNLCVVFGPFREQILSSFWAVEGRIAVAMEDDVNDRLKDHNVKNSKCVDITWRERISGIVW